MKADYKAFFFDMDGVLFDSMPGHAESWAEAMRRYGIPFRPMDAFLNEGRTGYSVIEELYAAHFGRHPGRELVEEIYACKTSLFADMGEPKAMEGVNDVLQELRRRDILIYVVTGSGQRSLLSRLDAFFPGIFSQDRMVTAFDVRHGKPDPEPYLVAWQKSGVRKSEGVVIENAPLGVQAGHAAGLFTIGVNTGPLPSDTLRQAGADLVLPDMHALLQWIEE